MLRQLLFIVTLSLLPANDVLKYISLSKKTFSLLDPINLSKLMPAYESPAGFIPLIISGCFDEAFFCVFWDAVFIGPTTETGWFRQ